MIPVVGTTYYLVAMITSQVENRMWYYRSNQRTDAIDCMVEVKKDIFNFLKKDKNSVVECNTTEYLSISEIVHRIDEDHDFKIEEEPVPIELREKVLSAISTSPLLPIFMQKLAKEFLETLATKNTEPVSL